MSRSTQLFISLSAEKFSKFVNTRIDVCFNKVVAAVELGQTDGEQSGQAEFGHGSVQMQDGAAAVADNGTRSEETGPMLGNLHNHQGEPANI